MKILFFDTETTGQYNFQLPAGYPSQPMIVQLGALLMDDAGTEIGHLNTLVKTDGWEIDPGAQAIHGISKERCDAEGTTLLDAIEKFDQLLDFADLVVAHNFQFDRRVLATAYCKTSRRDLLGLKESYCTMMKATPVCRIPKASGRGIKWPKLQEAYQFFFNEPFEGAHDAMADVRACARVYYKLNETNQV